MPRILLLGGSGFVGRAVAAALAGGPEIEVVGVGRAPASVAGLSAFVTADLTDDLQVRHLLGDVQPDVIVNCAGRTSGPPEALQAANLGIVSTVLAATSASTSAPRLIQLGSAAEYGPPTTRRAVRETDPPAPLGDYGRTKLAATHAILGAGARVSGQVLRVFNPVGAGAPGDSLVGATIRALEEAMANGSPEVTLGPLDTARDFVHAADVADAVAAATRLPLRHGLILNVGSGQATVVRDLVAALAAIAGYSGRVVESPALGSPRSGAVAWQWAETRAAAKHLGWRPRRTLDEALREAWEGRSHAKSV